MLKYVAISSIILFTFIMPALSQCDKCDCKGLDNFIAKLVERKAKVQELVTKANNKDAQALLDQAQPKIDDAKALVQKEAKKARELARDAMKLVAKAAALVGNGNCDNCNASIEKGLENLDKKIKQVEAKVGTNQEAIKLVSQAKEHLKNATTLAADKQLNKAWNEIKEGSKCICNAMKLINDNGCNGCGKMIEKVKTAIEKTQAEIDASQSPKKAEAQQKLTEAQNMYDSAVAKQNAGDKAGAMKDIREANRLCNEARALLKQR